MDHTPGQGQYRNLEFFKSQIMSSQQSEEEKERILSQRMNRAKLTDEQLAVAADMALQAEFPSPPTMTTAPKSWIMSQAACWQEICDSPWNWKLQKKPPAEGCRL